MSLCDSCVCADKVGALTVVDYAPKIFHAVRCNSGVSTETYCQYALFSSWFVFICSSVLFAVCRSWGYFLSEIQKPKEGAGRSGSLFLLSKDRRFLFKSLPDHEVNTTLACVSSCLCVAERD